MCEQGAHHGKGLLLTHASLRRQQVLELMAAPVKVCVCECSTHVCTRDHL